MTITPNLRLGTRGSKLAMAQAHALRDRLAPLEVEIVKITTSGDKGDRDKLGAFVREIQQALLDGSIDVALHCLKDLPTEPIPGLSLTAYLEREDPRDALIGRVSRLSDLPEGATVGTGSVRRSAQIASVRPDLKFKPLVGNVDTRMRKLIAGEYDAIVLAIAGLKRLGVLEDWSASEWGELTVSLLSTEEMLPAPGQAVLVLETRSYDVETIALIKDLNHEPTRECTLEERALLAQFGGGCSVPVGALARFVDGQIVLEGLAASPDGKTVLRGTASNAVDLFKELSGRGATKLFEGRRGIE